MEQYLKTLWDETLLFLEQDNSRGIINFFSNEYLNDIHEYELYLSLQNKF